MSAYERHFLIGRSFPGIAVAETLKTALEQRRLLQRVYGTPTTRCYIWARKPGGRYELVTRDWVQKHVKR